MENRPDPMTLAFAEARRDGALDTGVIDLVMKASDDAGAIKIRPTQGCQYRSALLLDGLKVNIQQSRSVP